MFFNLYICLKDMFRLEFISSFIILKILQNEVLKYFGFAS